MAHPVRGGAAMKKRVLTILNCNLFKALLLLTFAWLVGY